MVRKIENTKTKPGDKPEKDVIIKDCGSIPVDEAFSVEKKSAD